MKVMCNRISRLALSSMLFFIGITLWFSHPVFATSMDIASLAAPFTASNNDVGVLGAVASAGDIDGDGYDDFLIGAPTASNSNYKGAAYLVYGDAAGISSFNLSGATKFTADNTSAKKLGASVAAAGDVNGDGFNDFLIAATEGMSSTYVDGSVYLFYGSSTRYSGTRSVSTANVVFTMRLQTSYTSNLGAALAVAGDMDGDGYDDFLIGAPYRLTDRKGATFLVYGKPDFSATVQVENYSIPGGGGSAVSTVPAGVIRFDGTTAYDQLGYAIDGNSDVDADGKPDVILGAPNQYTTSSAYVLYGKDIAKDTMSQEAVADVEHLQFTSENSTDQAGYAVALAGDMDGDSRSEVIIGAPYYVNVVSSSDYQRGAAYVFYGSSVVNLVGETHALSSADAKYVGEYSRDQVGSIITKAGDVNNDGRADILVGSLNTSSGTSNRYGAVYVVFGSATPAAGSINVSNYTNPTYNIAKFSGQGSTGLGYRFAAGGHLNNDDYDDIVFLSGFSTPRSAFIKSGSATITSGTISSSTTVTITAEVARGKIGTAVAGAGDMNNDGFEDLIVGAANDYGAAYVILGGTALSGNNLDNAVRFSGEQSGDQAGFSVTSVGDMNSDGYDDVIIGAPYDDTGGTDAGAAYLVYGSATPTSLHLSSSSIKKFTGQAAGDHAGLSVASIADLNGDALPEIVIGAPASSSNAGKVYIIFSTSVASTGTTDFSLASADVIITGVSNDQLGYALSALPDINADSKPELLIGAPSNSLNPGAVYVFYSSSLAAGTVSASTANVKFNGEAVNDQAGFSVVSAGDVNQDALPDILIGAPKNDATRGAAYLVYGSVSFAASINLASANYKFTGEDPESSGGAADGGKAGYAVSGAGDVNNDGSADILVGAPVPTNAGVGEIVPAAYYISGADLDSSVSSTAILALSDASVTKMNGSDTVQQTGITLAVVPDIYDVTNRPAIFVGAPCGNRQDVCTGKAFYGYPYTDRDEDTFNEAVEGFSGDVDCDDYNSSIHPDGTEICDAVDNNCDGNTDEGLPEYSTYPDNDGDAYGDNSIDPTLGCVATGYQVADNTDCLDADNTVYPGAPELCDYQDNNCDSDIDEGALSTFYQDADADTFGATAVTTQECVAPDGYVTTSTDCNDAVTAINPDAPESCNTIDDNCNGVVDENVTSTYYRDADSDGYGDSNAPMLYCTESVPVDYVTNSTDCNDSDATIYPGATDIPGDDIDQDCSGADAAVSAPTPTPAPTPTLTENQDPVSTVQTSSTTTETTSTNSSTASIVEDCFTIDGVDAVHDKTIAYVRGVKAKKKYQGRGKKMGIVRAYNAERQLVRCWSSFPKGGAKARIQKSAKQAYAFSVKYRSGTTLRVHNADTGEKAANKQLSPGMHRRKIRIGELDGKKKTVEIVTSVRRGRMIYIKIHSFNTAKQTVRLVKRRSIKNIYGKRYQLGVTAAAVKLTHYKRHSLLQWQPWM